MKQRQQFWGGVCMHWGVTRTSKSVCSMMWNRSWVTAYKWNGQSHLFFIKTLWTYWHRGAGIAQWLERRTHDWKVVSSNPRRNGRRILFSRVNFLCWLLFRYPFHPCVTAVARKRPWSFCQTCRWQVTAKHAYTLRMWLCMKWQGAWLYGVHRTCAEMAAVLCGTSHASAVSTPLRWILKKTRYKKLVTRVESHASAVSLLKRAENSAKKAIINQSINNICSQSASQPAVFDFWWKRKCVCGGGKSSKWESFDSHHRDLFY